MTFRHLISLLSLLLAACGAFAGDMEGPLLGYATDRAGTLRQLRGIPGASSWGDAAPLSDGASVLALSQRNGMAAVLMPDGVRITSLQTGGLSDPRLPDGFQPSLAVFSPNGRSLALYGQGVAYLVRDGALTGAGLATGEAGVLAVSGADDALLAGTPDPHSVFVLSANGSRRVMGGFAQVTGLAFLGNGNDLAIADGGARRVLIVRNALAGSPEFLLGQPGGAPLAGFAFQSAAAFTPLGEGPLRIASSADGNLLAVLAGESQAGVFYTTNNAWVPLACECGDATPVAMRGNAVFGIRRNGAGPISVLDADGSEPRLLFVPAEDR